ncbi:hypothetical protein GCM10028809_13230 [Spirosoma gilvum]
MHHPNDSISIGMKTVVAEFVDDIQAHQPNSRQSDPHAHNVKATKQAVLPEIPQGDFKVVSDHDRRLALRCYFYNKYMTKTYFLIYCADYE